MLKDDNIYLESILDCIKRIEKYTNGLSKEEFRSNEMAQDAVIRNIEIIGEASKRISEVSRKNNPFIPWKEMAGMRDKLIHDYFGVDIGVIWKTITEDIPSLRYHLSEIK
jgi:uncharacterized protein with HEPN domain